jgi:hypothetical protein
MMMAVVVGLVGLGGLAGAIWVQRRAIGELRWDLEARRAALEVARVENERLMQVAGEELTRLRADHAALPRLRGEIEDLKARIEGRAR